LGYFEKDDLSCVIDYLRNCGQVTTIGLWGRSMGGIIKLLAITSLMHAERDPSIAGMVIDSAMTSLTTLAKELCEKHTSIPNFVLSGALALVKSSVSIYKS
jgi:alpha-beta hydrolase superfamily lysophospholipase